MKKLPIFINMEGKKILIIGGGNAALIKIKTLLDIQADFKVISKTFLYETEQILIQNNIEYQKREVTENDCNDIFIVFAAADKKCNNIIAQWAQKQNILCCKADGKGDFIVPFHKTEGDLTVAVSTNGLFPLLGRKFCENLDLSIGYDLKYMGEQRKKIVNEIENKQHRKKALEELLKKYEKKYKNWDER